DGGDRAVKMVSLDWSGTRTLGRIGSGPEEYLAPSDLLPVSPGTLGIVDGGNNRLLLIEPSGELGETVSSTGVDGNTGPGLTSAARDADTLGNLYAQSSAIRLGNNPGMTQQIAIERWSRSRPRRDT